MNADEDDLSPATGRPPPPFIDQGEAAYKHDAGIFTQYRDTGV
jgi:hypothetical protein